MSSQQEQTTDDIVNKLNNVLKSNHIKTGLLETLDASNTTQNALKLKKEFQTRSVKTMTDIISFSKASTLTANPLVIIDSSTDNLETLRKWLDDSRFIEIQFRLELLLAKAGKVFLGNQESPYSDIPLPFASLITQHQYDPISLKTLLLEINIGELTINGSEYNLLQKYTYDISSKKYEITRSISQNEIPVPKEYEFTDTVDEINGIVFENNLLGTSDVQNVIHLMEERGSFLFNLMDKFEVMSPKVLSKVALLDKGSDTMENEFRTKSFISIRGNNAAAINPFTIFNPTLPNAAVQSTVDFLEDEIFLYSFAPRPSGTDKKAQQNDLEQTSKDQQAHNYLEFTKALRAKQYTRFFKVIATSIGFTPSDDFEIDLEFSETQKNLMNPDRNQQAQQKPKEDKATEKPAAEKVQNGE